MVNEESECDGGFLYSHVLSTIGALFLIGCLLPWVELFLKSVMAGSKKQWSNLFCEEKRNSETYNGGATVMTSLGSWQPVT